MINFLKITQRLSIALTTTVALAGALSLTSCQDEDNGMTAEEIKHDLAVKEFSNNFVNRYGMPDPNHTWGFGDFSTAAGTRMATRAADFGGAGKVYVNTNQWAEKDNNGYKTGDVENIAHYITVPGWPNFDGYYYDQTATDTYTFWDSNSEPNASHPAGDVTDFEIQYVSRWFRENPEPTSIELHLTDFFVQNVSKDYDRLSYPDGDPVTYVPGNNAPNWGMEHLVFKTMESNDAVDNTWTHMNNYNSGNTNAIGTNILAKDQYETYQKNSLYTNSGTIHREIKYVTSSGTEDFGYLCSNDDMSGDPADGQYYRKWVLVHLDWDEVGQDGVSRHRDGYYLAFDYDTKKEVNGSIENYEEDHYYSNWIIKISPAYPYEESTVYRRVMCEDLGNTFDFDFNDVVYDIAFQRTEGNYDGDPNARFDAIITLQAAGGTMPIYVGKTPTDGDGAYEAHKMLGFGDNYQTPVNVGTPGETSEGVANYRLTGLTNKRAEDIPIYVVNNGTIINLATGHNLGDNYTGEGNNSHQTPKPGIGDDNVPQRFCCPVSVQWMKECQFIEKAYPKFPDWAQDEHGAYRESQNEPDANYNVQYVGPWFLLLATNASTFLY